MKLAFQSILCLTVAACAVMKADMRPAAMHLPGNASRFAGDTLILAVSNRPRTASLTNEIRSAILITMRAAFPSAIVLDSLGDSIGSARRVRITANIVQYGPFWARDHWVGRVGIDLFVYDHRVTSRNRLIAFIRASSRSPRLQLRGPKTPGDVTRAAFDSANMAVIAFLDSVGDPGASAKLRQTAAVSEEEYAPYFTSPAVSSLSGLALVTIADGTVRRAVRQPVTLDPVTPSARRWYEVSGMESGTTFWDPELARATGGAIESSSPDDLFQRARRTTVTDAKGQFTFSDLASGTYLVRARVEWDSPVPGDGARAIRPQRSVVASVVTIGDGERKQITVSDTGNAFHR